MSVRASSERIETLLNQLADSAPPPIVERVEDLLSSVMQMYGEVLGRVVESVGEDGQRALAEDSTVGPLLVLHDLHPDDVDTRVQRALDTVRPYLGSHAGGVSLSSVDPQGGVHLRLEGSCDGCPSSSLTVTQAIEDAVLAACPDVVAVEAEGVVPAEDSGLLQIQPFRPADLWQRVELDVPPRTVRGVEVGSARIAVANLDGTLLAYLDRCPACFDPISAGSLEGDQLSCASCGARFDARLAGRAEQEDGTPLTALPLLPESGAWKVSIPEAVAR
jgi:Fe-S cluster biogenesis protein NfuA/nitrite reductase/ring-hydroxylating ferredoxin subunit